MVEIEHEVFVDLDYVLSLAQKLDFEGLLYLRSVIDGLIDK